MDPRFLLFALGRISAQVVKFQLKILCLCSEHTGPVFAIAQYQVFKLIGALCPLFSSNKSVILKPHCSASSLLVVIREALIYCWPEEMPGAELGTGELLPLKRGVEKGK